MCGIAGYSLRRGVADARQLKAMAEALAHRGPDGEGYFQHRQVGLAHRRLSIIDLAGGAQPLATPDGDWQLVANGEIYNYKALIAKFAAEYPFKTQSDCEVILPLFERYGAAAVQQLQGMYGIAAYQMSTDTLYLARDPFGIKPLYYHESDDGVAFASEPRALLALPWIKAVLNEQALPGLLQRQYSRGRTTLFAGIQRVLPGEVITIRAGQIIKRERYLPALQAAQKIDRAEALELLEERLFASIHAHVQADVPYGAFLSGGIDSSAMVTAMSQTLEAPVRTFTIGFADDSVANEQATATQLAQRLGTAHTNISFTEQDFWQQLDVWAQASDDLVADYAALPLLKLTAAARQDVTVILSGEGGDEILAGYGRYRRHLVQKILGKKLRSRGLRGVHKDIFNQSFSLSEPLDEVYETAGLSGLQRDQLLDISDWLPDDLLLKVDRALMWHGAEGRVPFLDDQLAAALFALPDDLKIQGKHGKWLLKYWLDQQANSGENGAIWGKKKGFTVPIKAWLVPKLPQLVPQWLASDVLAPMLQPAALEKWVQNSMQWSQRDALLAFRFTCLQRWGQGWLT